MRRATVAGARVVWGWGGLAVLVTALSGVVAAQTGPARGVWAQTVTAPGKTPPPPPVKGDQENGPPISKDQAKALFKSVDEILQFVSNDTKLPIHHSVKRRLISRDEVNRFLKKKFDEDEGAKRLEREELVLKKFGLLDRDFDLRTFLIGLLTEQIAGFYDNKTKTVNLLDWIQPEEQKPVLAHELTHALQDQAVDLERWGDSGVHGIAGNSKEDNRHLETDELETARDAVAEGQAMVAFLDYSIRGTGKTLADAPELANRLKDADEATGGSPILARAPLLLQQSLLFPYSEGLSFEAAVLAKGGKQAAFADVLARPPSSSYEIMNPTVYLERGPVPMLRLPDVHPLLDPEYAPYDVGVMGELDVRIVAELFGGREMSEALTPAWDGGVYYAGQRRSSTAAERSTTGSLMVFYLSRWKNPDSARSFARAYASEVERKYTSVKRDEADAKDDEVVYRTEEGDVLVSRSGTDVFVSEGLGLQAARKLRELVLSAQTAGPVLSASATPGEDRDLALAVGGWCRGGMAGALGLRDMLDKEQKRRVPEDGVAREQGNW